MSDKIIDLRPESETLIVTLNVGQLRRLFREEIKATLADRNSKAPTDLLTLKEAAKRLNQSKDWLYRHWKEVGGKKLGPKSIRFAVEDLEMFITKRGV
jgi:predicted DNA-binding transcriptional regulator AlpA